MGSCSSVDESQESKEDKNSEENFPKKQVDREMLVQTKKKDEEIRRNPGDIGGNQFIVDELENCKVIVTDICDSMTLDRCTNCELEDRFSFAIVLIQNFKLYVASSDAELVQIAIFSCMFEQGLLLNRPKTFG